MEIAADEGSFSAKINIGKLYLGGSPFKEKNLEKALALFTEVNQYYLYRGEYDATIQIIKTEMGIELGKNTEGTLSKKSKTNHDRNTTKSKK
jgi:hypothetical protein